MERFAENASRKIISPVCVFYKTRKPKRSTSLTNRDRTGDLNNLLVYKYKKQWNCTGFLLRGGLYIPTTEGNIPSNDCN